MALSIKWIFHVFILKLPTLCPNTYARLVHIILRQNLHLCRCQWKDVSCFIQGVSEMMASLKHLFSPSCCTEKVRQTVLYNPQRWKTEKNNNHALSEIQYKYRFMHTMKASFPIFNILVSATTVLQCSVVYMGIFFPHTWMSKRGNNKMCCVCSELLPAYNCCLIWDLLLS